MTNNLNNLLIVEIYGQKYSVVKLVPLNITIEVQAAEADVLRYIAVTPEDDPLEIKNYLMSYALIAPEFWIDRDNALYVSNAIDFWFNLQSMAIAEDFIIAASPNTTIASTYFGKAKMLADEICKFPEINWKTPLMWTYWDTPQSNPALVFKSTNGDGVNAFKVFFTATLVKLHIIPDDLVEPTL